MMSVYFGKNGVGWGGGPHRTLAVRRDDVFSATILPRRSVVTIFKALKGSDPRKATYPSSNSWQL